MPWQAYDMGTQGWSVDNDYGTPVAGNLAYDVALLLARAPELEQENAQLNEEVAHLRMVLKRSEKWVMERDMLLAENNDLREQRRHLEERLRDLNQQLDRILS